MQGVFFMAASGGRESISPYAVAECPTTANPAASAFAHHRAGAHLPYFFAAALALLLASENLFVAVLMLVSSVSAACFVVLLSCS